MSAEPNSRLRSLGLAVALAILCAGLARAAVEGHRQARLHYGETASQAAVAEAELEEAIGEESRAIQLIQRSRDENEGDTAR